MAAVGRRRASIAVRDVPPGEGDHGPQDAGGEGRSADEGGATTKASAKKSSAQDAGGQEGDGQVVHAGQKPPAATKAARPRRGRSVTEEGGKTAPGQEAQPRSPGEDGRRQDDAGEAGRYPAEDRADEEGERRPRGSPAKGAGPDARIRRHGDEAGDQPRRRYAPQRAGVRTCRRRSPCRATPNGRRRELAQVRSAARRAARRRCVPRTTSPCVDLDELQPSSTDGAGDDQADAGSKTFEREQEQSIAANRLDLLTQIQRAVERIDAGTYGFCESCGKPIPKARLKAFPMATLDVACKQREERR